MSLKYEPPYEQGEVLQATVQDLQAEISKLETRQYPPSPPYVFMPWESGAG